MRGLILVLVALASTATAVSQQPSEASALVLKDLQGRELRLTNYRGKVVLVNFWATWCPPCRTEIPYLIKLQREHVRNGLQVIGITFPPQKRRDVRSFVRRLKIDYPIALGTERTKALFTTSDVLPLTVVLGRDGRVKNVVQGILYPEEFEQKIRPLLLDSH